jgi:ribonucleoside-triphosphate reductase
MLVEKRDGKSVLFDKAKIYKAIISSATHINKNIDVGVATSKVEERLVGIEKITVAEIQNIVEDVLMGIDHDIARAYIEYRKQRDLVRESSSVLTQNIKGLMNSTDSDLLNENANKDGKIIPTQRDLLAGIVAKHYALKQILPLDIAEAHEKGEIHYHDLDYSPFFPMFNCMLIDLRFMLENGFKLGNAQIASPRSIATACAVTAQIIAQVASHIYGGNTINHIDSILAPYVRLTHLKNLKRQKRDSDVRVAEAAALGITTEPTPLKVQEKLAMLDTEKDTYDAFQSLEYEINTLHCANGQTPFTTLGFGLGTSWEEKLIQKSILKVRIDGIGEQKHTAVFPKLVFAIKKGVNFHKEDPNYDVKQLALECSSKRMYPDILNYHKNVEMTGSFKFPMGCRSFLDRWLNEKGEEVHDGRNNLGVVSLNLPRIAIEAGKDEEKFFDILNERLAICYKALWTRINSLNGVKANVAPILYMEGALGVKLKADDYVADVFKNGRASISLGYIGLHEVANAMFGNEIHTFDSIEKQDFIYKVINRLKEAVTSWKEETGYGFSLYSTPSESLCNRFCSIDEKTFGKQEGVTDKGYYTNSFHLDVMKKVNPYEKIMFEKGFMSIASGGHITYGEYPNMKNNLEALEDVWDFSYDHVPYYGTNTPVDKCHECGYAGEFTATSKGYECPKCGNTDSKKMNVIRRVCGYLGEPGSRPFIFGKQEEVQRRVKHL